MKKSSLIFYLALLTVLLSVSVCAQSVELNVEVVNDHIMDFEKGYAEFKVNIRNVGDDAETYTLWNLDPPAWFAQLIPDVASKTIKLAPGDTGAFHIMIKAPDLAQYNGKAIIVTAFIRPESDPSNPIRAPMRVVIGTSAKRVPPPDFGVSVSVPSQMDPVGSYNIVVNLDNKNERFLQDVSVKLSSNVINEETLVDVNPDESKSASFAVLSLDNVQPQQDQLHVVVSYQDKTFYEADHNFEVVEYLPPFKTSIAVEKSFLKQVRTITVTNGGNTVKTDRLMLQAGLKDKLFSSSEPKFEFLKEGGAYFFAWPISLEPGASAELRLVTSYRWLIIVAVLLLLYLAYRISRSNPLIVRKKYQSLHKEHKGAISDLVVVIYLKNRGKTAVNNIRVFERISRMVKLKHDSFEGSMHPVKMHQTGTETTLEYRFAEIGPGDERIIKYKVYSQLHIFGSLMFRPTLVEFKTKAGKRRKSRSRTLAITGAEPLSAKTLPRKPVPPVAHRAKEDIVVSAEKAEESLKK